MKESPESTPFRLTRHLRSLIFTRFSRVPVTLDNLGQETQKGERARPFSKATGRMLLRNPFYLGKAKYRRTVIARSRAGSGQG